MGTPIFILAGQSNAAAMSDSIRATLDATYGVGNYALVNASASGAPLTYKRSKDDWYNRDELTDELVDQTLQTLTEVPDGKIAGMIWVQGEADTYVIARADEYGTRLNQLFDDIREGIQNGLPDRDTGIDEATFVVSSLSENAPDAPDRPNWGKIISEQTDLGAQEALVTVVNPDVVAKVNGIIPADMFVDGLHYEAALKSALSIALIGAALTGADITVQLGTRGQDILGLLSGSYAMKGKAGDDLYVVDSRDDTIIEGASHGFDEVFSTVGFSLRANSQHLETLTLTGNLNITGTGNRQDNTIIGNEGDNTIKGAWGSDILIGGDGNDRLKGGRSQDLLTGGEGADVFVFRAKSGRDVITDFELGLDRMEFQRGFTFDDLQFSQLGADAFLQWSVGSVLLEGVQSNDLSADDFLFS